MRSSGRIAKTVGLEYEVIYPILLAKEHPLTKLIIMDCHNKVKHLGMAATLTMLRKCGYWVTRARQAVKSVLSDCCTCRKYNSFSFKYPKLTNLPKHRVNFVRPYKHTGIDYTGHIWVDTEKGGKKYYILIFTCLNVRSVHLELVESMSSATFVQAFIRFTNIYGIPSHIYSDNARSFKQVFATNIFNKHVESVEFKDKFLTSCIKHV